MQALGEGAAGVAAARAAAATAFRWAAATVAAVVATSRGGCWLQVSGMVLLVLGRRRWRARSSLEGDAGAWQKCGDAAAADGLQVTDAAR